VFGDLTARVAVARGIAAVVTDGAVRDVAGMLDAGLPVFAAAVTPNSPQKDGPGDMNVPIACGGQVIQPGDILVGDADGVVVVPRESARRALIELEHVRTYEEERMRQIALGEHIPAWVDQLLAERGATIYSDGVVEIAGGS
jgi:regulator of RNase E activity RraA